MRLTVRRRAVIALLIGLPIGWFYVDIGARLVVGMLARLRGSTSFSIACGGSPPAALVGQFNGCNSFEYRWGYALVELIIGSLIVAALVYALARWVTAPLRQMTASVEQLGPTNLGLRLHHAGPSRDETRRLADAVDGMLDRVGEGYEAQRRFAANASHELRTPLATQRALIEVSMASPLTPDQLELLSRQLLATNERNEKLIDGLLTLAETERGLAASGRVALDDVVREVVAGLRTAAQQQDVDVVVETEPAVVTGELPLLERLVGNLVQNAIKYNHPGGSVRVAVVAGAVLTVANTGPVVADDQVAGLFEPFRRLSGERLDHGGGVGLGLTIARSIVAAHAGAVAARPNPGGGLVVEVRLPPG